MTAFYIFNDSLNCKGTLHNETKYYKAITETNETENVGKIFDFDIGSDTISKLQHFMTS